MVRKDEKVSRRGVGIPAKNVPFRLPQAPPGPGQGAKTTGAPHVRAERQDNVDSDRSSGPCPEES